MAKKAASGVAAAAKKAAAASKRKKPAARPSPPWQVPLAALVCGVAVAVVMRAAAPPSPRQYPLPGKETTPLHLMAMYGRHAVVERMLSSGKFDKDALSPHGWSALHFAMQGRMEVLGNATLIARGLVGEHEKCIEILLRHGADPNITTAAVLPPLWFATSFRNTEAIKLLLAAGADVSEVADGGMTILHDVVAQKVRVVLLLLLLVLLRTLLLLVLLCEPRVLVLTLSSLDHRRRASRGCT